MSSVLQPSHIRDKLTEFGYEFDSISQTWTCPAIKDEKIYDESVVEFEKAWPALVTKAIGMLRHGRGFGLSVTDHGGPLDKLTITVMPSENIKQPTYTELEQLKSGDWLRVLLTCRKLSYCEVIENRPKERTLCVKEYGEGLSPINVHYDVGMRLIKNPLTTLALQSNTFAVDNDS